MSLRPIRGFLRGLDVAPFATAMAVLAMTSGARGIFDPGAQLVNQAIGPLHYFWAAVYFLGGLALALGMGLRYPGLEAMGCCLFTGGAVVHAIAVEVVLGWSEAFPTVVALTAFAVASIRRLRHLLRGQRQFWARIEGAS